MNPREQTELRGQICELLDMFLADLRQPGVAISELVFISNQLAVLVGQAERNLPNDAERCEQIGRLYLLMAVASYHRGEPKVTRTQLKLGSRSAPRDCPERDLCKELNLL